MEAIRGTLNKKHTILVCLDNENGKPIAVLVGQISFRRKARTEIKEANNRRATEATRSAFYEYSSSFL